MSGILKDRYGFRKKLVLAAIVVSVLPFIVFVNWPSASGGQSVSLRDYSLFATSIFGLVGTVLMLWQFLLGTRVLIRKIFPDMIWSLKIHRWLGTYGSLFVLLHPLLSIYALGLSVTYLFTPNYSSRYETYISFGKIAFLLFIVIWITSAIVRGRIKYRPWKYIHLTSYVLLPMVFLHAVVSGIQLGQSSFLLYYWYGLTLLYLVLVAVRVGYQFGHGKINYLIENTDVSGDMVLLHLQPSASAQGSFVDPEPGQYVYLQLDSVTSESHPFTVADYDSGTGKMTLLVKKYGRVTDKVLRLEEGETVLLDGPYGVFTDEINRAMNDQSLPVIMFAGGIGITPYIQQTQSRSLTKDSLLFNCSKTPNTALFSDLFRQRLGKKYVEVYSQSKKSVAREKGNVEFGRINKQMVEKYMKNSPDNYLYFICGPKPFMSTLKEMLAEMGVPKKQILLEEFNF